MNDTLDTLGKTVAGALGPAVTGHTLAYGELTVTAKASDIVSVLRFLRDDARCLFWCLIDITAVDWPSREQRLDVVYHLLSPKHNARIRVKIETDEETPVASVIEVFPSADWYEREIYDLYAIPSNGGAVVNLTNSPDVSETSAVWSADMGPGSRSIAATQAP